MERRRKTRDKGNQEYKMIDDEIKKRKYRRSSSISRSNLAVFCSKHNCLQTLTILKEKQPTQYWHSEQRHWSHLGSYGNWKMSKLDTAMCSVIFLELIEMQFTRKEDVNQTSLNLFMLKVRITTEAVAACLYNTCTFSTTWSSVL